jgi:N-acetylneuraminic acid mutarotase
MTLYGQLIVLKSIKVKKSYMTFYVVALTFLLSIIQQAKAGSWIIINPMAAARTSHTATLLTNGQVLVAGGIAGSFPNLIHLSSAELFNPATETWTNTGSMITAREDHTATLLTNGWVLVTGGYDSNGNSISQAELYNPVSGTWENTGAMHVAREHHTATLLTNGLVLVAGGDGGNLGNINPISSAELYNPITGIWTTTGSLNASRAYQTATLLANGKVLVAGGIAGGNNPSIAATNSTELFNPATGTWTITGALNVGRYSHTATLLTSGQVLVEAGTTSGFTPVTNSAELYNAANGTWTVTGFLNVARESHTATLLPNGQVLVAAGVARGPITNSAELYNPANGTWTITNSLNIARAAHTATLLADGKVLVAGGSTGGGNSVELYNASNLTATAFSLINTIKLPGGTLQFTFTNTPDIDFTVYGTTNLSLPFNNWTVISGVTEISPGQYQFADLQATSNSQYFYRVRSQ